MNVLAVLLLFTAAMVILPITGYFTSKAYVFEGNILSVIMHRGLSVAHAGVLGYQDGSIPGAIVAVLIVHIVIGLYVYVAWREGSRDLQIQSTVKSD